MAENAGDRGRGWRNVHRRSVRIELRVVDGPVAPEDEAYAREQVSELWRQSPRPIRCGRTDLWTAECGIGRSMSAIDAYVVLEPDVLVCAGAVGPTMRAAIDELSSRLRRRLMEHRDAEPSPQPRPSTSVAADS
jgi:hypothetical protein